MRVRVKAWVSRSFTGRRWIAYAQVLDAGTDEVLMEAEGKLPLDKAKARALAKRIGKQLRETILKGETKRSVVRDDE